LPDEAIDHDAWSLDEFESWRSCQAAREIVRKCRAVVESITLCPRIRTAEIRDVNAERPVAERCSAFRNAPASATVRKVNPAVSFSNR
jgi:hypothetical protein